MKVSLLGWKPGHLARNTLWAIVGQAGRLLIQAVYFILIARSLGASGYGEFVGVASLIAVLSAFVGLGTGSLLVKQGSRRPQSLPFYWGRALGAIGVSGVFLVLLSLAIAHWMLPPAIPRSLVLTLALADLLLLPVHVACTQVFQASERLGMMSVLHMTLSVARLLAAFIMISLIPEPTAQNLASYYLAATMLATVISVVQVQFIYGWPRWKREGLGSDLKQGLYFSSSSIAQYVTANIDKPLLAFLSSTTAAGVYAATQRVAEAALIPVFALMSAAIPRLFKHGEHGIKSSLSIARSLLPILFLYTIITALGLFLIAPWLPLVFGPEYQRAESVGRWFAMLPFLHMLHAVAADTLSGAGYQRIRSAVEVAAALLNVLLNFWLVQKYSLYGAVWALLAAFTFSSISLWLVIAGLNRK